MSTADQLKTSFFIFLKDKDVAEKEKLSELNELAEMCKNAITIIQGKGILSSSWLYACLDEIIEEKK